MSDATAPTPDPADGPANDPATGAASEPDAGAGSRAAFRAAEPRLDRARVRDHRGLPRRARDLGARPTENGSLGLPPWVALAAGGVLILGLIATIGLLRYPWAFTLGWVLQVLILAAGLLNPAMYFVGVLFGGLWWYCMVVGARIDRDRTAQADPEQEQE